MTTISGLDEKIRHEKRLHMAISRKESKGPMRDYFSP
jgi:hypothetical protein